MALNSFGGSLTTLMSHMAKLDANLEHSSGIWLLASRINHSCLGNCRRSFIGDMLLVRAAQDIPPDTELLWPYRIPAAKDHDYDATQVELASYGFVCSCELCTEAENATKKVLETRALLRNELSATFASGQTKAGYDCSSVDTAKIEKLLAILETTYSSSPIVVPRTGMWDPYLALTRMYAVLGHPQKVIWAAGKTLEMLGFLVKGAGASKAADGDEVMIVEKWGLVVD